MVCNFVSEVFDIPRVGGILPEKSGGVCVPLSKTLTLFKTQICDFSYPLYDKPANNFVYRPVICQDKDKF